MSCLKRKKVIHLSKAKRLLDILIFASAKKAFTAQEIADEFNISVRTVHRYILDLSDMGLPIYAEQGRNGGYKVLTNRVIPPILFTEEEAVSIFFAFQSLSYYRDLPFNTAINSVTHKLYSSLQHDAKAKVDKIRSYIAFWNPKRTIDTPLLTTLDIKSSTSLAKFKTSNLFYRLMKRLRLYIICFSRISTISSNPPVPSNNPPTTTLESIFSLNF